MNFQDMNMDAAPAVASHLKIKESCTAIAERSRYQCKLWS